MKHLTTFVAAAALVVATVALAGPVAAQPPGTTITTGIQGASGSTIGPDGALYVTESATGQILRVDPASGATSVFASGLPTAIAPIGGPMDLVFHNGQAYVLVSLVGEFFGSADPSGIYRMDGPNQWTVIADLGTWAIQNPPRTDLEYEITTGVHYAMDTFRGGFVVSEAHHNKVVHVSPSGTITLLEEYGNTVPAGLDTRGGEVLVAMSGATPHLPEDGQVVAHLANFGSSVLVATGAPLLVDVELGSDGSVYGLAQGFFRPGQDPGAPAEPDTGQVMRADGAGEFQAIHTGLNRPTSMEVVGDTIYVVGMGGDVVRLGTSAASAGGASGGASDAAAPTEIAFTGAETQSLAIVGALLVTFGVLMLASSRRLYESRRRQLAQFGR